MTSREAATSDTVPLSKSPTQIAKAASSTPNVKTRRGDPPRRIGLSAEEHYKRIGK